MHQGVCGKMAILKESQINLFRVLVALVCALLCLTPGLESADAADVLPDAKYAVQVYGIEHDVDENEVPFGLTFGPALGGDFSIEGHQHAPSGTIIAGNAHRCIHTDSWADIIHWNYEDPYVYEQCVPEGCTQSVPIYLSSKIRGAANKYSALVPGDGAILYLEITDTMRAWNSASTTPGGVTGWENTFDGVYEFNLGPQDEFSISIPHGVRYNVVQNPKDYYTTKTSESGQIDETVGDSYAEFVNWMQSVVPTGLGDYWTIGAWLLALSVIALGAALIVKRKGRKSSGT